MWRFCVNPVAAAPRAFFIHQQIAQQKCVSPDLKDLRISYFFEKEGHHHGYSMPVSDVLTFLISAFIIAKTYKELNTEGVNRV